MITTATATIHATELTGVWQLVEVNAVSMQNTAPYGQLNRKEIYTDEGELLVASPTSPFSDAKAMGYYEVQDGARVFTSPDGETVTTPIQWIDRDHYFFEFSPGERWYYARVLSDNAESVQWEPRSVLVVRTTRDDSGPMLREFPYDMTEDSEMPWAKRIFGTWETIRVAGSGVSGPNTPPYGMPNDRFLFSTDGILRKVHADGTSEGGEDAVRFRAEENKLVILDANLTIYFWFNRWGHLVLEQQDVQTVFKRVSLETAAVPPGPIVVALLSNRREEPLVTDGRLVEISKSDQARLTSPFPAQHS